MNEEIVSEAEATAKTNAKKSSANANDEIISVEATEVPQIEAQARPFTPLPNNGVLLDDDVFLIGAPDVKQYPEFKKGTTTKHTYAFQDYYLFPINGKVFTTRDKNFAEAHKMGNLYSVTLGERVVGTQIYLELMNYITRTQKDAQRRFKAEGAKMDFAIKQLEAYDPSKSQADANLVNSLLAGVLQ